MSNINNGYDKEHKEQVLSKILERSKGGPVQRTKEWYDLIQVSFGGSDQAAVSGRIKGKDWATMIASKVGLVPFSGILATRLGTFTEKAICHLLEMVLDMKIEEIQSIVGPAEYQRFSPDGVAVAHIKFNGVRQWLVLLIEIKSPYSRIPIGEIPIEYTFQLKTGMCTLPEVDLSLFSNCMIRICNRDNYEFSPVYSKHVYPLDVKNNVEPVDPIAMGTMIIFQTKEQSDRLKFYNYADDTIDNNDSNSDDGNNGCVVSSNVDNITCERESKYRKDVIDNIILTYESDNINISNRLRSENSDSNSYIDDIREDTIDFAVCSKDAIDRLLKLSEKKCVSVYYVKPCVYKRELSRVQFLRKQKSRHIKEYSNNAWAAKVASLKEKENTKFVDACKLIANNHPDNKIVGYISWKLFRWDIILYENDEPDYFTKVDSNMKSCMEIIKEIRASNKPWDVYHKHFPRNHKKYSDAEPCVTDDMIEDAMLSIPFPPEKTV